MARYFRRCPNQECPRLKETGKAYQTEAKDHVHCPICDTELPPYDPTKATSPKAPKTTKKIEEDKTMMKESTKKINPWWILAILAVVILAILAYGYLDEQNDRLAAQSEKITALEAAQTNTTPGTTYVYVPSTVDTATTDTYDWGWDVKETKILLPGYVAAGDVIIEGIKYFDEGGVNEATLVINQSSRGLATFAEWGAGELRFADNGNSTLQLVRDEFATGGDPDARTVRVVVVTDSGITQAWYNNQLQVIRTTN